MFSIGSEPWTWLVAARGLGRSAVVLYRRITDENERLSARALGGELEAFAEAKEHELIGSSLVLAALSVENLIKGVLVSRQPGILAGGKLPDDLNTRNLQLLCDRPGIDINDPVERDLLAEFTDVLKWMGRCPIPAKYRDFMPRKKPDGTVVWRAPSIRTGVTNGEPTGDFLTFARLFDRLASYAAARPA